jgi:hypothetical protein
MAAILEEKEAIHEIIANYCFYFDGGEFDKWVDLFTDDAVFDGGALGLRVKKGKDMLRAFVKRFPLTDGIPMMKHCVMNEIIKVNGDKATAKSYFVLFRSKGKGTLVNGLAGCYEDELVKQGNRWLFKKRRIHMVLAGDM